MIAASRTEAFTDRPAASASSGPLVPRLLLGRRLRALREECGMTRGQAARAIGASTAKLSRMERGRTGFKERDVVALLTLYGLHDKAEHATALALVEQSRAPGWWDDERDLVPARERLYLSAEQSAWLVRSFEPTTVPVLLQTPDYARADIARHHPDAAEDELRRRVMLRLRRQRILRMRPRPVNLWVVLDEAVLWRPVGGTATMRAQIQHILEVAQRPNVTVQVAPHTATGHLGDQPFTLVRFHQHSLPDLVYLDRSQGACYPSSPAQIERHWHAFNTLVTEASLPEHTRHILTSTLAAY
ncbi:transcriptional regulator [Actinomadura sp. NBRC 104425]|uniref:helix-turn-helix domain-containing protein n=1 Tax=Actinomadura sp. NBRC 104425 TaxID=3032204 RepID=UPI0024A5E984|nr:helix-turn-helix transcriptional regulator [Actinomadura sp. NBRC 104425]GLZ14242.1 transcriptional regulator [Actinomadura sp. NBRC 104425]